MTYHQFDGADVHGVVSLIDPQVPPAVGDCVALQTARGSYRAVVASVEWNSAETNSYGEKTVRYRVTLQQDADA